MWCRYRDGLFRSRFSDRRPRYFSLLRQRKVSKRKAARISPSSCASRFLQGLVKGAPAPSPTSGIPAAPLRAIPAKNCDARGRNTGTKPSPNSMVFQNMKMAIQPNYQLLRTMPFVVDRMDAGIKATPEQLPRACRTMNGLSGWHTTLITQQQPRMPRRAPKLLDGSAR